ncbi:MAG: SDR family oxidoreductase [Chloroflexi bacterium]|nr:SDR family oxidoreductase [Chloroflexota bacterium]
MVKVVVTGGAGFIGSHLAEALAERGYQVIILDDLSTGRMVNIEGLLLRNKNVEFVRGSITDFPLMSNLFREVHFVFHQAAISSTPQSVDSPQTCHEVNVTGTLNVLTAARDNRVKKVILASSCAVYGDSPVLPKREDMLPLPLSPYAVTKLAGEHYSRVFSQVYGIPTVCLRYFNIYGPRQNPDSEYSAVIPKFIKGISQVKPITIFGDGNQTRDFAFVKDVVAANILSAESAACGVFNIGSGEETSINTLAQLIINLMGNNVTPLYQPPRPGDIVHSFADISKIKSFGFSPKYTLEEGLKETLGVQSDEQ